MRIASALAFAIFALSIAVQWNDPDPLAWMLAYALPAALAGLAFFGRSRVSISGVLAAGFSVALLWWAPSLAGLDRDAVSGIAMKSLEAEQAREAGGLLLCWAWCVAVFASDWRSRRAAPR